MIENAAREPEIGDVADCLNKMGARISGAGTSRIVVEGVTRLGGARHSVLPDRIETGTYAMAVAMTGGDVLLEGARPELLQAALDVLAQAGAEITADQRGHPRRAQRRAASRRSRSRPQPFPGFPTDLQAQLMALMTRAKGTSRITETIFENRFMHVQELARLGARIQLDGETATIEGVEQLKGAPVMATDLRASVSLVIAALAAEGETMVNRVYHLDRGFERLEDKLARLRRRDRAHQRVDVLRSALRPAAAVLALLAALAGAAAGAAAAECRGDAEAGSRWPSCCSAATSAAGSA